MFMMLMMATAVLAISGIKLAIAGNYLVGFSSLGVAAVIPYLAKLKHLISQNFSPYGHQSYGYHPHSAPPEPKKKKRKWDCDCDDCGDCGDGCDCGGCDCN